MTMNLNFRSQPHHSEQKRHSEGMHRGDQHKNSTPENNLIKISKDIIFN